mmetsp:Transcript_128/g.330  ORF Transcript_128/g.330 Transcript_128/m.330 type:complete len:525 (+) Transcript_128:52-1626(+)
MYIKEADVATTKLRFEVGTRVECNCGGWEPGTIVKQFYRQSSFPPGTFAPYQVRLDNGKLIYAPIDEDRVCRAYAPPDADADDYLDDEEELPEEQKLAVTVITGFLGAGKTTLVNYVLNEDHGKKICVIENEFGAINIDTGLVAENMKVAEEVISMDNGCACCTVRGDLVRSLQGLKKKLEKFDMVMFETTGLADPAPIMKTFQQPEIMTHFRVDGVVCLVDSMFLKDHINEVRPEGTVNEAVQQVAFADKILLNKTDLVSRAEMKELRETVGSINSFAEQIETRNSRVPLDKILGINAFSLERMADALDEYESEHDDGEHDHEHDENGLCMDPNCTHDHEHGHSAADAHGHSDHQAGGEHGHGEHGHAEVEHGHAESEHGHAEVEHGHAEKAHPQRVAHTEHGHHEPAKKPKKKKHDISGVSSVGLTSDVPLNSHEFNKFMHGIIKDHKENLYRTKGVVALAGEGDTKFVFQGVHDQIQFTPAKEPWGSNEVKQSKVVFIGRHLDRPTLAAGFALCSAKPDEL